MIRIMVVDDQALVRRGLSDLLGAAEGIEVVGELDDGPFAADAVADLEPDIVLMDLSMPVLTVSMRPARCSRSGRPPRSSC